MRGIAASACVLVLVACAPTHGFDVTFENVVTSCDGNFLVTRRDGVDSRRPCGDATCIDLGFGTARCMPAEASEPACSGRITICRESTVVSCFGPFVDEVVEECTQRGRSCRAGACVLSIEPDPRCTALADGKRTFCDGNLAVQCAGAFHQEEHECTDRRCVDDGSFVECRD